MKILLKESKNINRDEISIEYHYLDKIAAKKLYNYLNEQYNTIELTDENSNKKIEFINKIYYIQSTDRTITCYFKKESKTLKTDRITKIRKRLLQCGFIQINKTTYINMNYVESYKIIDSAKREIRLSNDTYLIVSRRYKDIFEQKYLDKNM